MPWSGSVQMNLPQVIFGTGGLGKLYAALSNDAKRANLTIKLGESIIEIKRIGICGTDLPGFERTQPIFAIGFIRLTG